MYIIICVSRLNRCGVIILNIKMNRKVHLHIKEEEQGEVNLKGVSFFPHIDDLKWTLCTGI